MTSTLEDEARRFAEAAHEGQRYGDAPYVSHLAAVRAVLADFGYDGALGVAAWLHDTVEDTPVTREEIGERFGADVAELVWAVTGEGPNRKARNASAYAKIRATPQAALLKLADRIANVEASHGVPRKLEMYRSEWRSFHEQLGELGDLGMWARLSRALGFDRPEPVCHTELPMRRTLRVLLVSDDENAAAQIARELARGEYDADIVRVSDTASLETRLAPPDACWDVVLAHDAAYLSPLDALATVRRVSEETALVIVRYDGELDTYVDTIPRQEGTSRLAAAMNRVVHEAHLRAQQRELRDQILVSERLASVGFLVAGIAHEINNPLAAVIANQEYVRSELTRLSEAGNNMKDAIGALDDAILSTTLIRQVVRDLHTFSQTDNDDIELIDARAVLERALRMTLHEIRDRARLIRDLGPVPRVKASVARMSQVFLNLLINAAQAIPTGRAQANEIRAVTRTDERGNFVAEIHDTGSGIAPEHLPHIFDPFFTTKPPGTGTGLGLAVSHRLVERYGGTISVVTRLGIGSSFTVTLPSGES